MQSIKCNICNQENEKDRHYRQKCGKNLSNLIEKQMYYSFSVDY